MFRFRLAEQLGTTVGWLDENMTSSELTEWMQFERITGPLGRRRADINAAMLAAVIAGVNTPKGARKPTISDFLIDYSRVSARKSPTELLSKIRSLNAALKGP